MGTRRRCRKGNDMRTSCASLALATLAGCVIPPPAASGSYRAPPPAAPPPAAPPPAAGADGRANITVPNVFAMSRDRAVEALRRAGVQGSVSDDSSLCGSVTEGRVIEVGQVCYQHPPPGRVQGARLSVSLRVQTQNPWHGNQGRPNEWRLMPNVIGMSLEHARAVLQRVGFTREDRLSMVWVDEPGCTPLTVCRTYPPPMERAGLSSSKFIYAGRDPDAKPKVEKPAEPDRASEPTPPATTPERGPSEPQPEPFF